MNYGPELLLVAAVATVGVLHTIVPDHWVPITLIARQRGWSKSETARAALQAGIGHVLSTLLIALVVWLPGGRFCRTLRPHRRHGLEPRTHCLWRLVRRLRMARSADAWRSFA
jgi:hypothetical protein